MLYYRAIDKCLGKMNEKRMRERERERERGDGRKVPPGLLVFVNMKRRRNTYIYICIWCIRFAQKRYLIYRIISKSVCN